MAENWVSHEKLVLFKKYFSILPIFRLWFSISNCSNTSRPKCVDTLRPKWFGCSCKQYIYNRKIRKFWHRKLCMKNWYSSKSLHISLTLSAHNVTIRLTHVLLSDFYSILLCSYRNHYSLFFFNVPTFQKD